MVDLMKSNNEAAGSSGKRELQGVKHNIALPTLVKINFTNDIAKDAQSYQNWWCRFETYIRQRTTHAGEILSAVNSMVDATLAQREALTEESHKEMLNVDVILFRNALSKRALIDYDSLCSELYAAFPQHIQTICKTNAINRKANGGIGSIEIVEAFYYLRVDFSPTLATDYTVIYDGFINSKSVATAKNCISYLQNWYSSLQMMLSNEYINADDNHVRLFVMLQRVEALFPLKGQIAIERFMAANPVPHRVVNLEY